MSAETVDRRPDYDELLRLAEAATPGPWQEYADTRNPAFPSKFPGGRVGAVYAGDEPISTGSNGSDAAYIAAASPDVVAALIRENRQQAERIAALENLLTDAEGTRDMYQVAYADIRKAALRVMEEQSAESRHRAILDLECVVLNGEPCAESRP